MCKLSIITISYNNLNGLKKTIESVINQTYIDYEFIVIDGGSTDGSADLIEKYASDIYYWISEKDRGIYNAMNKGVMQANGEFCIFMNSGDMFYDCNVLTKVFSTLHYADVMTGISFADTSHHKGFWLPPRELSFFNLYNATLSHQASFIRNALLRKFPYDENLKIVSDWKFYLESLILSDATYAPLNVIVSKHDSVGISGNVEQREAERENVLRALFPERILCDYAFFNRPSLVKRVIIFLLCHCSLVSKLKYIRDKYKCSKK